MLLVKRNEEQGTQKAAEWGCPFMEVSAKEKVRNEECFFEIVRQMWHRRKRRHSTKGRWAMFECIDALRGR